MGKTSNSKAQMTYTREITLISVDYFYNEKIVTHETQKAIEMEFKFNKLLNINTCT